MKTYSIDLRQRVVEACKEGESTQKKIAELFGVSLSWVESLLRGKRVIDHVPDGRWESLKMLQAGSPTVGTQLPNREML